MKKSVPYTLFAFLFIGIMIISLSIALPILYRPFYYHHIEALNIPQQTGHSYEEIKEAYNQVIDYCTGITDTFSAGVFPFSSEGAAHFQDVRGLFLLDFTAACLSFFLLLSLYWWGKKKHITVCRLRKHGPAFWAPISMILFFSFIGGLASLNFPKAFTLFHSILFPGKENWLFSETTDPIINALPETFFQNCAIFILINLLILSAVSISFDSISNHKRSKKNRPMH